MSDSPLKAVNDKARKVRLVGKQAIVPLKFDAEGNLASADCRIVKRLSLRDLRFLSIWKATDFKGDIPKLAEQAGIEISHVERLIKKLACFREEDARVRALAEIPTSSWIKAKHVENFYEGGSLQDSEHKSLQELAKIEGAYKQQIVSATVNVFNLPKYDPATEAKLKAIAEQEALLIQDAQIVVNG